MGIKLELFFTCLFLRLATSQEYSPTPTICTTEASPSYPPATKLPDPFLLSNGSRLATKEQWACKRAEIREQLQNYELGVKPPKPTVSSTFANNKITITSSLGDKSATFAVTVKLPSGTGPFPALIAYEGASIPLPSGVALLTFPNHDVATDDPRGTGKFYALYGTNHLAGALMAWAWGVSRLIDALEQLGPVATHIDASRLAVTGCSWSGKGALIASAFDDRIALAIPQEGGSGGPGCWRIVADIKKNGTRRKTRRKSSRATRSLLHRSPNTLQILPGCRTTTTC